jgi:hypothetical protein
MSSYSDLVAVLCLSSRTSLSCKLILLLHISTSHSAHTCVHACTHHTHTHTGTRRGTRERERRRRGGGGGKGRERGGRGRKKDEGRGRATGEGVAKGRCSSHAAGKDLSKYSICARLISEKRALEIERFRCYQPRAYLSGDSRYLVAGGPDGTGGGGSAYYTPGQHLFLSPRAIFDIHHQKNAGAGANVSCWGFGSGGGGVYRIQFEVAETKEQVFLGSGPNFIIRFRTIFYLWKNTYRKRNSRCCSDDVLSVALYFDDDGRSTLLYYDASASCIQYVVPQQHRGAPYSLFPN